MDAGDLVPADSELKMTENSPVAVSTYESSRWRMRWESENFHPERKYPCFWKKVMKGSLHHLPQSLICIPTYFMQAHQDTFRQGNLITLEGRSGNTWKVRATGKPVLHSGWRAFAHDHGLREGDELCFTLTQPLHFVVDVLNCHGIVRESALTAINTGKYRVASVCYPYEYVHRARKRRVRKISATYRADSSYGVPADATIASRCKTTARERSGGDPGDPNMQRFRHKRKQWKCRQEEDGREVFTILDSDDDGDEDDEERLLDHMELSFGTAQVQTHRTGNIQQLVAYMKQPGEFVPPRSNLALAAGEDQKTMPTQTTATPEIAGHGEVFVVAENANPLQLPSSQTRAAHDEDTIMLDEGDDILLPNHDVQLQICAEVGFVRGNSRLRTGSKSEVFQPHTIPATSLEVQHENAHTVAPLVEKADLLPPSTQSNEVVTSGGDCLFATLRNIVDMPMIVDTMNSISEHPSIPPESVLTNRELIEDQAPEPKESSQKLKSSSATKLTKPRELPLIDSPGFSSKTSTTACVLRSKRVPVAKLHRAQTLRAAQAMTKKLRSPTFLAVMKSSNVYTDFTMDIPAEFGKKSRLPVGLARVTLVCDEVPTMCKAVWIGTNPEQPKLGADAWMEFSRSHFLEEGDVCVFELFNRVTIRIGIHIFRVVGLRRTAQPAHWNQHYSVVHLDGHKPAATLALAAVEVKP